MKRSAWVGLLMFALLTVGSVPSVEGVVQHNQEVSTLVVGHSGSAISAVHPAPIPFTLDRPGPSGAFVPTPGTMFRRSPATLHPRVGGYDVLLMPQERGTRGASIRWRTPVQPLPV